MRLAARLALRVTDMLNKSKGGRPKEDLELARQVITRLDETQTWDQIKSRDVDPAVMDYVKKELTHGVPPHTVAKALGFKHGVNDRRWSKIQAGIRLGFRVDAEAYLYLQSKRFFTTIEKARQVLEDAFENGVPVIVTSVVRGSTITEVIRVKGATKELASFIKTYSEAIKMPVDLWKAYGAIGDKKEGNQGVTIVVQNNIPMPTEKEILDNQARTIARSKAIDVKP